MPNSGEAQISLFCSRIKNRRLDDDSLRILESVLVSKTVRSLVETRSILKEFLRSESLPAVRETATRSVDEQLSVLEFFVRAFASIGDIESCLAIRYEGLLLREHKSATYRLLQVSYEEWLCFAEHCLDNGFYAIAIKGCENALSCVQRSDEADSIRDQVFENLHTTEKINKLKNRALVLASSHSVQAQAAEFLRKKEIQESEKQSPVCETVKKNASIQFRNGIKNHNLRKLRELQRLPQINSGLDFM